MEILILYMAALKVRITIYNTFIYYSLLFQSLQISLMGGFHGTFATDAASQHRMLTPPGTLSCPICDLHLLIMLKPFFLEFVMSTDLFNFEHPSVLLLCLSNVMVALFLQKHNPGRKNGGFFIFDSHLKSCKGLLQVD